MRNKKGLTLVEVIVSIALIGIIAVGMIPAFAAQFRMTVDTKDVTINSFNAQAAIENVIHELKDALLAPTPDISGIDGASTKDYTIFGRSVTMYKLVTLFPDNANKDLYLFMSQKLAQMEKKQLLVATGVWIDISDDAVDKVADMKKDPSPTLTGKFDANSDENWYVNVYKWYVSKEGNPNPVFPDDYEMILIHGVTPPNLADLSNYVNRYIVFTVTPVDIHGVRGNEVSSTNRVYVLGEEWRSGVFAWIDKNDDISFADETDVDILKLQLQKYFDSAEEFLDPAHPDTVIDPSDGSLYVPMCIDKAYGDTVGPIEISGTDVADWLVDKSINLATDITVENGKGIDLTTRDGDITLYQYILIDQDTGDAVFDAEGFPTLIESGPTLSAPNGDIALTTEGKGNINLQDYTTLIGQDIGLASHGPMKLFGSALRSSGNINLDSSTGIAYVGNRDIYIEDSLLELDSDYTAGRTVTMNSRDAIEMDATEIAGNSTAASYLDMTAPDGITLNEANFSHINIRFHDDAVMTGGGWDSGYNVSVDNDDTITFIKGTGKVLNAGSLDLGDTGEVNFDYSNATDLTNPLQINLEGDDDEITVSTNYGRNVGYADAESSMSVSNAGVYEDLGSGSTNLEFTANKTAGSIMNLSTLRYDFDGIDTISINGTASGPVGAIVKLTVRDKYTDNQVYATITFTVTAPTGGGNADITINGTLMHTVIFQDWNGTVLKTQSVAHEESATPPASPVRSGYVFAGWDTDYSSVTGDLTITALYTQAQNTVTFDYFYGRQHMTQTQYVYYGASATPPANPLRIGYNFAGWDSDYTNITASVTITAQYTADNSLTLYLDASALTGLNNNDSIQTWADLSGKSNNMSQGTNNRRPKYLASSINGKPAVVFDRDNNSDYMTGNSLGSYVSSSAYTTFVVGRAADINNSNIDNRGNENEGFFGDSAGRLAMYLKASGFAGIYNATGTGNNDYKQAQQSYTEGTWKVFTASLGGGNLSFAQNGGAATTVASGNLNYTNSAFELGRVTEIDNDRNYMDGHIAEVIVFNRALSAAEKQSIEAYLKDKYGL